MKKAFAKHKYHWSQKKYRLSLLIGVSFFALSLLVSHQASTYANIRASNYVNDILLDNLPTFDVDGILNYGVIAFSLFFISFLFTEPKKIPFILKSLALFVVIRSVFITLTHLGPLPGQTPINPNDLLSRLILGNDYFFSGHTGMPFLIALILWKNKIVRYVSIFASLLFATSVILGHLHYSIDVFAAFFITYSIFHIAIKAFPQDYKLSHEEENSL
ncbi:MAG TPA: phosphatase PAP2-related protein [Patescibacteria group bacterium]